MSCHCKRDLFDESQHELTPPLGNVGECDAASMASTYAQAFRVDPEKMLQAEKQAAADRAQ